jgi:hypothetical protein
MFTQSTTEAKARIPRAAAYRLDGTTERPASHRLVIVNPIY